MSRPPSPLELQHLGADGAVTDTTGAGVQSALVAGLRPSAASTSGVASPAANGEDNARSGVPKSPRKGVSRWKMQLEWWPELSAALLSVLILVATAIFLARTDGTKLDDWHLAWQIKPPTIVSILVTLCRITLAFFIAEGLGQLKWVFFEQRPHRLSDFEDFDEATRGPWGAICFVWRINRRAIVATFGATMAILILAMDPFSQQVLYYDTRTSNATNAVATIPVAQLYDSGALYAALSIDNQTATYDPIPQPTATSASPNNGPQSFGQPAGPATFGSLPRSTDTTSPDALDGTNLMRRDDLTSDASQSQSDCSDTLMARAAYAGLYSSVSAPDFTCSSGNCTWPSFTTLGVCSECKNITSRIKATCNIGWGFDDQTNRTDYSFNDYDICWYELVGRGDLPGNASYPGPGMSPSLNRSQDTTRFSTICSGPLQYWPLWLTWASNVWDKSRDLLSFTSYRFPKNNDFRYGNCVLPMAHVEQCTLHWCAKTFDTAVAVNGMMNEGLNTDVRLVSFDADNRTCPGLNSTKAPARNAGIPMQGLIREDRACPQSGADVGPHDIFWVNRNDHVMTVNMLGPMIDQREMDVDSNGATYSGHGADSGSDAAMLTALWDNHGGNLSLTLQDIAASMTNRVRLADGHLDINGTSTRDDTVIKVTWYWLIYMVAMVGLSLAFFFAAVIFSGEKSRVVWKSSTLAVLMHGLADFDRTELDARSIHGMSKAAKDMWAQLETDNEGSLRLVRH